MQLVEEIAQHSKILAEKNKFLASKEEQYRDVEKQVKEEEDRKYEKEKEIDALLEEMQDEAEQMAFQEFVFMRDELCEKLDEPYKLIFTGSNLMVYVKIYKVDFKYWKN